MKSAVPILNLRFKTGPTSVILNTAEPGLTSIVENIKDFQPNNTNRGTPTKDPQPDTSKPNTILTAR